MIEPRKLEPHDRTDFARLLLLLRPHWRRILRGTFLGSVVSVVALISPLIPKQFFDTALPRGDRALSTTLAIGVALVGVGNAVVLLLRSYVSRVTAGILRGELSLMLFDRAQHMELAAFENRRLGDIMSRFIDMQRAGQFIADTAISAVTNTVLFLAVPAILVALDWRLALLTLATTPLAVVVVLLAGPHLRRLAKQSAEASAEANGFQVESLGAIRTIKGLSAEPILFVRFASRMHHALNAQLRQALATTVLDAVNVVLRTGLYALYCAFAWRFLVDQSLSMGSFIAFAVYSGYLTGPIDHFVSTVANVQELRVWTRRFFELYDERLEAEPTAGRHAGHIGGTAPSLSFHGVHFGYSPDRLVLRDANFSLGPGGIHALVGPSGEGKSSIVRLLFRLNRPQQGAIMLDGRNIAQLPLPHLRGRIGVVWPDGGAFAGSIRDNLRLGYSTASTAEMLAVLDEVELLDFIDTLPSGLDTSLAEWGGTLSSGQRQRLAVARMLLRSPDLLILDEATSAIDQSSEHSILSRLRSRARNVTILLVTHRLQTAANHADSIHFVHCGSILSASSHQALLTESVAYARFATSCPDDRPKAMVASARKP